MRQAVVVNRARFVGFKTSLISYCNRQIGRVPRPGQAVMFGTVAVSAGPENRENIDVRVGEGRFFKKFHGFSSVVELARFNSEESALHRTRN